ncbi:MAG: ATP-binding protein [Candidatus Omnitrophota bacterium]
MIKPNPFTPQSGWEPKIFGGRQEEIKIFKNKLSLAASGKAEHLIVLGQWGIGKTSLLRYYKKLAQESGFPAALCPIGKFAKGDRTSDGVNLLVEELQRNFLNQSPARRNSSGETKRKTLQPQTLLTNTLSDIWANASAPLILMLLDDVQNFLAVSGVIDIIRLVLSRDEILKNTKYLFVLSSTPDGWQLFLDKHDPIGRFFRERVVLCKLTQQEARSVIKATLNSSGVEFSDDVIEKAYQYTQGHPYELQLLCSNLYEAQIEGKVDTKLWQGALENTLRDLGREYFEVLYRQITDREAVPLQILARSQGPLELKAIEDALWSKMREFRGYPIRDTKNYIYRLLEKNIVRKTGRGEYEIFDKMFGEYFLSKL